MAACTSVRGPRTSSATGDEAHSRPSSNAFFDAEARAGKVYSSVLRLPPGLPAWDVYLVFGPEVRWERNPPVPAYWMHQLGRAGPPELRLDGEQLERVVRSLLPKTAGAIPTPGSLRPGALSPKGVGVKTAGSGSGHAFQACRTQRFMAQALRP